MNNQTLLDAINGIDDKYIYSAQQKLARNHLHEQPKRYSIRRKIVALIAAVVMLMGTTFTVAMAASPEFREAVFAFFGIEQPEVVPEHETDNVLSPDDMVVDNIKTNIGGVIEGTYLHTPIASYAETGVFLICTDETQMKQGSHYDAYREDNGELVKLETYHFNKTLDVNGFTFQTDFEWTEVDGRTIITYMEPSAQYFIDDFAGLPEKTLVLFYCWTQNDEEGYHFTNYPAFLNLETGAVTDVLTGTGAENIEGILKAATSEDQTKMLFITEEQTVYYVDLLTKQLHNVAELSGEPITDCTLVNNSLVCWRNEDETSESGSFGKYRAWSIDLNTFEKKEMLIPSDRETLFLGFNTPFATGNMYAGSCFAIQVDAVRNTYIVDLEYGTTSMIANFDWPGSYPYIGGIPSPDGRKLLIFGEKSGNVFDYIGVLDFDRKVCIQFSRENNNAVNEHSAYWFDNEKIVVKTDSSEVSTDYYVYELCYQKLTEQSVSTLQPVITEPTSVNTQNNANDWEQAKGKFETILSGKGGFFNRDQAEGMTIQEYCNSNYDMVEADFRITQYALSDLDHDGTPELILWENINGVDDCGFLVIRYDGNGGAVGYEFSYHQLIDLKYDGTFGYSGGVASTGFATLTFNDSSWEYEIFGCVEETDSGVSFKWGDLPLSEDEYWECAQMQTNKETVKWMPYPAEIYNLSYSN